MDESKGAEGEGGRAAWCLIERATNSTEPEIDPRLLKVVKSVVRSSKIETQAVVGCLMGLMKKPHSQQARYRYALSPAVRS